MKKIILGFCILFIGIYNTYSQTDSVIFKNGNFMVGEVKTMNKNVMKIETGYSDADFAIEWSEIKEIYTKTIFLITLSDGNRYNSNLKSTSPGKITILKEDSQRVEVNMADIVILDDIESGFWNQVYASIDIGFDLTKANNFKQVSVRSNLGYVADRWQLDGTYNTLGTEQDEVDDIRRTDGSVTFKYFLPHDWYPMASVEFLSNTEQQLKLRTSSKLGIGKYIVHTNSTYWGFSTGGNNNNETYSVDSIPSRNSWEAFIGTELNMFNIGDLSLLTSLTAYPSLTESGRWRVDYSIDGKYDLPMDFYIKLGFTYNWDNLPAPGSSETDYVFHSGFGWSW
jgi:Protein of unknown function, DUF481